MSKSKLAFKPSMKARYSDQIIQLTGELPGEGSDKGASLSIPVIAKDSVHERRIHLTMKLAEGGEGAVYKTDIKGYVAKIYFRERLTSDRRDKLKIMISKPVSFPGICFPEALVLNSRGEFTGYLMREAKGFELGRSIFQPKLLLKKFPKWNKRDLIDLSLTILDKIKYLNELNVIMGDINPANILVVSPKEVYFVDCDSYQVEGFPCPVGTANFTAPEAQGRDYKTFLRTQEMENFAIATLLFMIMLPGKAPYSVKGGASPEHNIKEGIFPYPHKETETDRTPPGKWGYIWSHMSYRTRLAFYENFRKGEPHFSPHDRYDANQWISVFKDYRRVIDKMIHNDPMSLEVFPSREKMKKCKDCGKMYVPDRSNYTPYCAACDSKYSHRNTYSGNRVSASNKKTCPYCGSYQIPAHWNYCNNCKDKVVARRECANCHKPFPVTVSLDAWEKSKGAKRKLCDVCSELRAIRKASPSTTKIQARQPSQQAKSGCYIATAVYGSYNHPQTIVLRNFRDQVLLKSRSGRVFVKTYYAVSPHIVRLFGEHESFNAFWRKRLDTVIDIIQARYDLKDDRKD